MRVFAVRRNHRVRNDSRLGSAMQVRRRIASQTGPPGPAGSRRARLATHLKALTKSSWRTPTGSTPGRGHRRKKRREGYEFRFVQLEIGRAPRFASTCSAEKVHKAEYGERREEGNKRYVLHQVLGLCWCWLANLRVTLQPRFSSVLGIPSKPYSPIGPNATKKDSSPNEQTGILKP